MLELQRNLYVLRRWWWLLLSAAILGALVAYALTKLLAQQQYQATAVISMAPPPGGPNGLYITTLAASADAQLVQTLNTAQAARTLLPSPVARTVDPLKLTKSIIGAASLEGELLYISVNWPDQHLAPMLTNAVANGFIREERKRLEQRWAIIHAGLGREEQRLAQLTNSPAGSGQARSWLQAQYADTASRIYQQDADARIQASTQEASLQLAQPASTTIKIGPKASVNAILGGILALIIALVVVFVANKPFNTVEDMQSLAPVLSKVGE